MAAVNKAPANTIPTTDDLIRCMAQDKATGNYGTVVVKDPANNKNYKGVTFNDKRFYVDGKEHRSVFKFGNVAKYWVAAKKGSPLPPTVEVTGVYSAVSEDDEAEKNSVKPTDRGLPNDRKKNQITVTTTRSKSGNLYEFVELYDENKKHYMKTTSVDLDECKFVSPLKKKYSIKNKDEKKRGKLREDPVIKMSMDFNLYPENFYDASKRGQPRTVLYDYTTLDLTAGRKDCKPLTNNGLPITAEAALQLLSRATIVEMAAEFSNKVGTFGVSDKIEIQKAYVILNPNGGEDEDLGIADDIMDEVNKITAEATTPPQAPVAPTPVKKPAAPTTDLPVTDKDLDALLNS